MNSGDKMNYLKLTKENLESEHICCAISSNKDPQVIAKKKWLEKQLDEGLVFLKADQRGKCFIEYLPAEKAFVPIEAKDYLYIDCFWVSGSLAGHGYGDELLEQCISEGKKKGKSGLCVISSPKKQAFLSDPDYLKYKGFKLADQAEPFFDLLYLPFRKDAIVPKFKDKVKKPQIKESGFVIYYTADCPFTAKYVPLIEKTAKEKKISLKTIFLDTREKAQNAPCAWTNYAVFYNGEYVTNEILSEKKLLTLAEKFGVI